MATQTLGQERSTPRCRGGARRRRARLGVAPAAGLFVLLLIGARVHAQDGSGEGTGAGAATAPEPAGTFVPVDVETFSVEVIGPDTEVSVGEPVTVTVHVDLPPGVTLASVESVHPGRLEFEDRTIDAVDAPGGGSTATARMVYVSFRPGTHELEALDLSFRLRDGANVTRRVPGVEVRVRSLIANEQNPVLRPEKGGVPVRYRDYTVAWVGGVGGALLCMGLLGFLLARNRPRVVYEPPPPPPRPAHEIALEKLDAIKTEELIERGEPMAFAVRLSETIREYLGNRYGFDGLEATTTETYIYMTGVPLPAGHDREAIRELLYACDLVKFAKGAASASEEQEALAQAYALVNATKLVVLPPASTGASSSEATEPRPAAPASAQRIRIEPTRPNEPKTEPEEEEE